MGEKESELKTLDEILAGIEVDSNVDDIVVAIEGVSEAQLERVKKVLQLFMEHLEARRAKIQS